MSSVGVVILNWNGRNFTTDCLDCFRKFPHNYDLILVDNNSDDDSVSHLKKFYPEVTLIDLEENLGFAGGNNVGIQYCIDKNLDYLILLNNDTLFEFDFIAPLVADLDLDPSLGAVQPKILFNHDRNLIWNGGGIFYNWLGHSKTIGENARNHSGFDKERRIDWITGCAFMVRCSVIKEVGMLDDRFFIYHEDVDWSLRIRKKGYQLKYAPKSVIYHWAGSSRKAKKKGKEGFQHPLNHYLNFRNRYWAIRKNLESRYLLPATLFHLIQASIFLGYFLIRRRFTKFGAIVKGVRHGFGEIRKELPTFTV